jgi:hypothetical protein
LRKDSIQLEDTLREARTSLTRAEESLKQYADGMNRTLSTARTKTVIYTILAVAAGGLAGYVIGQF